MFCIGGVAALKRHPFFEDLDWTDLINLRIAPPIDLSIPYASPATPAQNTVKANSKASDLSSPSTPVPKDRDTDSPVCASYPNGPPAPQQLALTMEHLTRHFHEDFTAKHINLSDVEENNSTSSLAGNSLRNNAPLFASVPLRFLLTLTPFVFFILSLPPSLSLSLCPSPSQAASLLWVGESSSMTDSSSWERASSAPLTRFVAVQYGTA
jgi:hypothetical protein